MVEVLAAPVLPKQPDGKMAKVIVAFDVDGTLIRNADTDRTHGVVNPVDTPNQRQIDTLKTLSSYKNIRVVVWSGGGKDYAAMWGRRLGLDSYVWRYASKLEHESIKSLCDSLIAIDDIQSTALGDVNLIVREK